MENSVRLLIVFLTFSGFVLAQAPKLVAPVVPKRVPPAGVAVPEKDRRELEAGAAQLAAAIAKLHVRPELADVLPDVQIFHKAVDWALRYDEVLDPKQIAVARGLLTQGMARVTALAAGRTPWLEQTGMVMRAYRSQIDGSLQPYGLLVPDDWKPGDRKPRRLDFWCHGRNEKLTELAFLDGQARAKPEFAPQGAFVCFLYGRLCNANKFAGERDLFEAWDHLRVRYPVDNDRIVVRGFSMGGGATWHFATQHAGLWAAAAPGAGFAETAEFAHVFDEGKEPIPPWEQKLWHWTDATVYAANLANTALVAYSGEIDKQKQAADIMLRFAEKEGLTFPHIIGPQTAHKYHPEAKPKIEALVTAAAEKGRAKEPQQVHLTTYTLIYPNMRWVELDGLEKSFERADVTAKIEGDKISATTRNINALRFVSPFATGLASDRIKQVVLDGATLPAEWNKAGAQFHKEAGQWKNGPLTTLHKNPGVCGPLDHAFMSRFLFVRPTGRPLNATVGAWTKAEMELARSEWRRVFRGEAPIKDDVAVTADDIANANLIFWGDTASNKLLAKLADRLPLRWSAAALEFGGKKYDAACHAPVLIFPNPLNAGRYIVLNSGITFRSGANNTNSDQTPKLPDWAIVDLRTPPGPRWPGRIAATGFFDDQWQPQGETWVP
ncbi:MAG: prolyl oligopeptidase family serine peptidase [Kiritimatiellaeota bacterium]|nr:prolyl oligopeptidase family serine peptidase [Kiritimatiellota bacterium]